MAQGPQVVRQHRKPTVHQLFLKVVLLVPRPKVLGQLRPRLRANKQVP